MQVPNWKSFTETSICKATDDEIKLYYAHAIRTPLLGKKDAYNRLLVDSIKGMRAKNPESWNPESIIGWEEQWRNPCWTCFNNTRELIETRHLLPDASTC